jgi:hypothetical protein
MSRSKGGFHPRLDFAPPKAATDGGGTCVSHYLLKHHGDRITGLAPFVCDAAQRCRTLSGFAFWGELELRLHAFCGAAE